MSYGAQNHSLFCAVCMAFSKKTDTSAFIQGCKDWRHIHQKLNSHENTHIHLECVNAYLSWISKADIPNLLDSNMMSARRKQVRKRRQVLERVIDVTKLMHTQLSQLSTV